MNKIFSFITVVGCISLILAGCGPRKDTEPAAYSNLSEGSVRLDLDRLMREAGISDRSRAVLFEHADQFQAVMEPEQTAAGFRPLGQPLYDPYALQDAWDAQHPDFLGYNCRITAFGLMEDGFLQIAPGAEVINDSMLVFDLDSLAADPSAHIDADRFRAFYSMVPTEMTADEKVHAETWVKSWEDRGIQIVENPRARLISVIFHMEEDGQSWLYVGHTGVLFPTPDGGLWFLEKLAFQEPYQVVSFSDRGQLSRYLMEKYDVDQGQPVAKPFILENGELLQTD